MAKQPRCVDAEPARSQMQACDVIGAKLGHRQAKHVAARGTGGRHEDQLKRRQVAPGARDAAAQRGPRIVCCAKGIGRGCGQSRSAHGGHIHHRARAVQARQVGQTEAGCGSVATPLWLHGVGDFKTRHLLGTRGCGLPHLSV
eukprot:1820294-Prymnesium_polylepis.1